MRIRRALIYTTTKSPGPGFRPQSGSIDHYLGRLAAAWVARVQRNAGSVIVLFLIATAGIAAFAAATLGINSSETDVFSKDLRVMEQRAEYFANFPVLRDPIACKPAVMAENDDWVAMASEFRAIAQLPGVEQATVWEPAPATVYSWGAE